MSENGRHLLRYERDGDRIRLQVDNMSGAEYVAVLVGLWLRLEPDDAVEFIYELLHYAKDDDAMPSELSRILATAERRPGTIDVNVLKEQEHGGS